MNSVKDITENFRTLYYPKYALVFYHTNREDTKTIYVEHFVMDSNDNPINDQPLTVKEGNVVAKGFTGRSQPF